jgi:transposase
VIGAVSADGRFYLSGADRALRSTDVVRFLKHLQQHLGRKLLVVWDGAPIHYGQVKTFLAEGGAADIHLERLPAYAPELNPVEGIWRYLKQVELRNVCCADLDELWY